MTYFTISLNGRVVACAGSSEVRVLTASVIATAHGPAQLTVNGLSTTGGERTYQHWPSWNLSPQDQVAIVYTAEGQATAPVSTVVEPELPLSETLARLRQSYEQLPEAKAKAFSHTRAPRRARLSITTGAGSVVEATLGDAEQLQAVVCFAGSTCKAEVDSLTVQPDGTTRGVRWLAEQIETGQSVTLTYAA
jgi:hypothetical protein